MFRSMLLLGLLLLQAASPASGQDPTDDPGIRQAALDYIEGWYEGDPVRMERALHPDLAKRIVVLHPRTGRSLLNHATASMMVEYTRAGGGKETPRDKIQNEVTVLDVYHNIANVRVVSADFVDYLHVVKWNGEWRILNVLWEPVERGQAGE